MKKILFVDDEPAILEGLQDLLRSLRHRWDMSFICGGQAAIATVSYTHLTLPTKAEV